MQAQAQAQPLHKTARAVRPRIITLDLETVPDPIQFARSAGASRSMEEALEAARAGNVDRCKELLGEDFKPGQRSKPDALVPFVEAFRDRWAADAVKRHSVDPTLLAICSWAAYTEDPEPDPNDHGSTHPTLAVCSWGTDDETETQISNVTADGQFVAPAPTRCLRYGTVDARKPLLEMTDDEQWQAEHLLLLNLWGFLGQYAADIAAGAAVVTTFNGCNFDVPAIQWRSMRHRAPCNELPSVRPSVSLTTPRFATRPHLDVAQVVWRWERQNSAGCGLVESMNRMGFVFSKPEGMNGHEVYPAACNGEWAKIEDYNMGDVVTLHHAARLLIEGGMA